MRLVLVFAVAFLSLFLLFGCAGNSGAGNTAAGATNAGNNNAGANNAGGSASNNGAASGANNAGSGTEIGFDTKVTIKNIDGATVDALPAGYFGEYYGADIYPSKGTEPFSCVLSRSSSLPGEIAFYPNSCSLGGDVPAASAGTTKADYPFQFTITDANGNVAGPFSLTLTLTNKPPEFSATSVSDATTLRKYYYSFCGIDSTPLYCENPILVYGGVPPYRFSVSGQPIGISMRSDGQLSGTIPEGATLGNYTMDVCVADSTGTEACSKVSMRVKPALVHINSATCKVGRIVWADPQGKSTVVRADITISGTAYSLYPDSMLIVNEPSFDTVYLDTYKRMLSPGEYGPGKLTCAGWSNNGALAGTGSSGVDVEYGCTASAASQKISWTYTRSVVDFLSSLQPERWSYDTAYATGMRSSLRTLYYHSSTGDPEYDSESLEFNCTN